MSTPNAEILALLEYRLRAVAIGHIALLQTLAWDRVPSIEIFFDGKIVIEGKATAFTNGAIESAIVHCRALLEFLGLCGKGKTILGERLSRSRCDDIGIEHFHGLSKLSVQEAVQNYAGPKSEAEEALAYAMYLANKGLAHTTSSFTKQDRGSDLLEIAFRGVPALVVNSFYLPLKIKPPSYEVRARERGV